MRRTAVTALALALAAAAAPAAVASGGPTSSAQVAAATQHDRTVTPVTVFRSLLPTARRSGVPVLLPGGFRVGLNRVYPTGGSRRGSWDLELGAARNCGGATACFVASFTGQRGGRLGVRPNVTLANGVRGVFYPLSCGASCSPPSIQFVVGGVLYDFQVKALASTKAALVRMANQAILAGAR